MIQSFADEETEAVYLTGRSRKWGNVARIAARRLQAVDFASAIEDLLNPPGNRLEKLKGDRKGFGSVVVRANWRVTFHFEDGDAYDVNLEDYH